MKYDYFICDLGTYTFNGGINMDTQEISINNVVVGPFRLLESPITAQITIHINNMILTYGNGIIQDFKEYLSQKDTYLLQNGQQIVEYYGEDKMREYFSLIYGWTFEMIEKVG